MCTSEELMNDRIATWGGLWGVRGEAKCCSKVLEHRKAIFEESLIAEPLDDEEIFPIEAVRKCIRTAPGKAALGQWAPCLPPAQESRVRAFCGA